MNKFYKLFFKISFTPFWASEFFFCKKLAYIFINCFAGKIDFATILFAILFHVNQKFRFYALKCFFLNSTLLCLRHWIAYWKREFFYYHKFSIIWTQQNLILGSIKIVQVHSFNVECVSKIFGRSNEWVWWIIGEQTLPIDGRIFWLTMIFDLNEINTCFMLFTRCSLFQVKFYKLR